ncbi:thiamine pyrophosphate-dependent dehydrogenase E1 component subunit alpha [Natronorarus salvus]|uniref:thiamine pyrophosphate-dependent dehydrogenase E1 component subunit alpha n=1 Tax=Natronorarus salvus TaxID=3117733 RepID=UPI002F26C1E2
MSDTADEPYRVLSESGEVREGATVPDLDRETLLGIYVGMRFSRRFDERAISLQRQGRIGTYPSLAGQEASGVASTYALADDDWIQYQYREHGAAVVRGLGPEYLRYWMGDEAGNAALADDRILPINITIGGQIPHAVGLAWASALDGAGECVVCHFGEGATSEGDFHEAANFAGVFDVPVVLFCNNNGWAISHPAESQTASETFAGKATAYGIPSVRVDGMDPLAVYEVTKRAVERTRDAESEEPRPTLVEAVQYRFGAHTTADDPTNYRDEEEVERWRAKDPIPRMERFLRDRSLLDDATIDAIETRIEEEIADLIDGAEAMEVAPDSMFEYVFAEQTPRIAEGQAYLRALRERHGDEALVRDE